MPRNSFLLRGNILIFQHLPKAFDLFWVGLGQMAVGNVVLNRVASPEFPNSIQGVIFDRKHGTQFEPVDNGTIYDTPTESAVAAAKAVLAGQNVVGSCKYFFAPALSQGTWMRQNRTYYTTIGCHRFYL